MSTDAVMYLVLMSLLKSYEKLIGFIGIKVLFNINHFVLKCKIIVLPARVDVFGDSHLPRIDIQPLDASESSIVIKSLDIILISKM